MVVLPVPPLPATAIVYVTNISPTWTRLLRITVTQMIHSRNNEKWRRVTRRVQLCVVEYQCSMGRLGADPQGEGHMQSQAVETKVALASVGRSSAIVSFSVEMSCLTRLSFRGAQRRNDNAS